MAGPLHPVDDGEIARLLGLQKLHLVRRPEWGADHPGSGDLIRQQVLRVTQATPPAAGWHLDTSISHTPRQGGFVSAELPLRMQIGLDIETIGRVTAAIVRRVCRTEAEFVAAPSHSSLWAAKEAAFKSLKGAWQPTVLADVEIGPWKKESRFEIFEFSCRQIPAGLKAWGLTWSEDLVQIAVAVCNLQKLD